MVLELTLAIVRMAVKRIDSKSQVITRRLISDGACSDSASEAASDIASNGLVHAVHVKQLINSR